MRVEGDLHVQRRGLPHVARRELPHAHIIETFMQAPLDVYGSTPGRLPVYRSGFTAKQFRAKEVHSQSLGVPHA